MLTGVNDGNAEELETLREAYEALSAELESARESAASSDSASATVVS